MTLLKRKNWSYYKTHPHQFIFDYFLQYGITVGSDNKFGYLSFKLSRPDRCPMMTSFTAEKLYKMSSKQLKGLIKFIQNSI
jgi:hypothetical protein